jgi:hypothetical protein
LKFRYVYSVSMRCSVYCLCVNVYWITATGISGHFTTTLTEGFPCFFFSVVRQMSGYNSQRQGTAGTFQVFFNFIIMSRSVYSVYCLCVNVYCTAATGISVHFSTTLRFLCASPTVVMQMPGYNSQSRGTARTSQFVFFLSSCMFRSVYSVYFLCVNVYCTAATGCQPNCS